MAVSSRTSEFREYVRQKEGAAPDAKRRKLSRPGKRSPEAERQQLVNKEYVKEAYNVVSAAGTVDEHVRLHLTKYNASSITSALSLACFPRSGKRT